jgi:L-ribulose-5-phosphate 3-epimerase
MLLGYDTNGFSSHALDDAIRVIGGLGYRAVAITLDHHALSPFAPDIDAATQRVRRLLDALGLVPVIETGARYLLDPWHKDQPTLLTGVTAERMLRLDFLRRAIDVGAELGAFVVSLRSGAAIGEDRDQDDAVLDQRLIDGLGELCEHAAARGLELGLEPAPEMQVATLADFARVRDAVDHPALRLTLDVGHAQLTERDIDGAIRRALPELVNVHLEGTRRAHHEHLVPWEGDLDVGAALRSLAALGYAGPACFELSRHAADAVEIARRALAFADEALRAPAPEPEPTSRPARVSRSARAPGPPRAPSPPARGRARRGQATPETASRSSTIQRSAGTAPPDRSRSRR